MNISSPVTDPVTPLAAAPAILAAANLILPHLERGQRVDAAILRGAMETAFGASDVTGVWDWKLAHLMVSRSETARALLTPGEIMQLPPTDEIVMVAGTLPIRATKARYYEDTRFAERVLPPPDLVEVGVSGEDDWSSLAVPTQDEEPERLSEAASEDNDPTGSERRLQPELVQPQPVDRQYPIENEFEFDPPEDEEDGAVRNRRIMQQMRGVARQVSLNPDDGMEL